MRFYMVQWCTGGIPDDPVMLMSVDAVREYVSGELKEAEEVTYDDDLPVFIEIDEDSEIRVWDIDINSRQVDADGFVEITRLHRDDLKHMFTERPDVLAAINEMPDHKLEELAEKMADDYCGQLFHSSAEILFEERILPDLPVPNGFFECVVCHEIKAEAELAEYTDEDMCDGCYWDEGWE